MDTTLLSSSRQPLDDRYRLGRAVELSRRGYEKEEIREIFRRADLWIRENTEPNPGNGKWEPSKRQFSAALAEVLQDGVDIATGTFLAESAQDEQKEG